MTNHQSEMWLLAQSTALYSKDPLTKVGAVACRNKRVIATGRNGFPPNIPDTTALYNDRKLKLLLTTHAEANLIAASEVSLYEADLYVTFPPCNDCAKLIITAGFKNVYTIPFEDRTSQWCHRWTLSKVMFEEVGINCFELNELTNSFENANIDVEYLSTKRGTTLLEKATYKLAMFNAFSGN